MAEDVGLVSPPEIPGSVEIQCWPTGRRYSLGSLLKVLGERFPGVDLDAITFECVTGTCRIDFWPSDGSL